MALLLPHSGFIHIPKCGGSTVRIALRKSGYNVKQADESGSDLSPFNRRAHARPDLVTDAERTGRMLFTFLREPVPWYRSYWTHRTHFAWTLPQYDEERAAWHGGRPFDEWVQAIVDLHPGFLTRIYSEYTAGVQFIGRTENLLHDLNRALAAAGEETMIDSMGRENASTKLPVVTPAIRAMIQESEQHAFQTSAGTVG